MSIESRPQEYNQLFAPACLAEAISAATNTDNTEIDAVPILAASKELGCTRTDANGITRRILICARCTVVSWIEHDKQYKVIEVQNPDEIRDQC